MKKTYQGMQDKSKAKFEVLGKRELLEVPKLPMVEVWGGVASPGGAVDRGSRFAHHRHDFGKRSDAARGTAAPAGSRRRARCAGDASRVT